MTNKERTNDDAQMILIFEYENERRKEKNTQVKRNHFICTNHAKRNDAKYSVFLLFSLFWI